MNATPLPVSSALAGPHDHVLAEERDRRTRARAHVPSATRIWAIDRRKSNADLAEHLQRDDHRGEMQPRVADASAAGPGTAVPRIVSDGRPASSGRAHRTVMVLRAARKRSSRQRRGKPSSDGLLVRELRRSWHASTRYDALDRATRLTAAQPDRRGSPDFDAYLEKRPDATRTRSRDEDVRGADATRATRTTTIFELTGLGCRRRGPRAAATRASGCCR